MQKDITDIKMQVNHIWQDISKFEKRVEKLESMAQ